MNENPPSQFNATTINDTRSGAPTFPGNSDNQASGNRPWQLSASLLIMAALMVGVWLATSVLARPAFEWRDTFEAARTEATEREIPILLDFWGAYCPPCRMLDVRIFADDDVAAAIATTCVPFKVDLTNTSPSSDAAILANKFNVQFTPTVILVDPETLELIDSAMVEDLANVEAFVDFLTSKN